MALLDSSMTNTQAQLTRTAASAEYFGLRPPISHVSDFKYDQMMASSISYHGYLTRRNALTWTAFWKLDLKELRRYQSEAFQRHPRHSVSLLTRLLGTTTSMENKMNAFAKSCYTQLC